LPNNSILTYALDY